MVSSFPSGEDMVPQHSYSPKTPGAFTGLCFERGSSTLTQLKWDRMSFITCTANSSHLVSWWCLNNENPLQKEIVNIEAFLNVQLEES